MFRPNVAALIRCENQFVACCRSDYATWQCVQGGIEEHDLSPAHAIERELTEELGLLKHHYKITYQSQFWRRYYFTKAILAKKRFNNENVGQQQLWFLIDLDKLSDIHLETSVHEFDRIELVNIERLLKEYSFWKKPPFYDFCRELGLV